MARARGTEEAEVDFEVVETAVGRLAPDLVRGGRMADLRRLSGGASQETFAFAVMDQ